MGEIGTGESLSPEDFVYTYFVKGIVEDSSYNYIDLITYFIILVACAYAVMRLLDRLNIDIDDSFIFSTVPYILAGSVLRVAEDAGMFQPPLQYFFITPLLYFVIFAVCFTALLISRYRKSIYRDTGIAFLLLSTGALLYNTGLADPRAPLYAILISTAAALLVWLAAPYLHMPYLRKPVSMLALFAFLLDASSTYVGVDMLGYHNKHPSAAFIGHMFGSNAILIPLVSIAVITALEQIETGNMSKNERGMTLIVITVLGLSMGARNILRFALGV